MPRGAPSPCCSSPQNRCRPALLSTIFDGGAALQYLQCGQMSKRKRVSINDTKYTISGVNVRCPQQTTWRMNWLKIQQVSFIFAVSVNDSYGIKLHILQYLCRYSVKQLQAPRVLQTHQADSCAAARLAQFNIMFFNWKWEYYSPCVKPIIMKYYNTCLSIRRNLLYAKNISYIQNKIRTLIFKQNMTKINQ